MKTKFKEQFYSLEKIIKSNVKTLKDLLTQSQELGVIIQEMNSSGISEHVKRLEKNRESINKSIDKLISETEALFKTYDNLVDSCFEKK